MISLLHCILFLHHKNRIQQQKPLLSLNPKIRTNYKKVAYQPVHIKNLSWVRFNPKNNLDNLRSSNKDKTINELRFFKQAGGKSIVECTPYGIGRDASGLAPDTSGSFRTQGAGRLVGMNRPNPPSTVNRSAAPVRPAGHTRPAARCRRRGRVRSSSAARAFGAR